MYGITQAWFTWGLEEEKRNKMVFANVLVSGSFSFRGIIIGLYNPNPTQPLAKDSHNYMPYSFRIVCEFFNVPHNMEDVCETFIVLI